METHLCCICQQEWHGIRMIQQIEKEFTQYADFAMYQIKRTVKDQFGNFDKEAYRTSQKQYNKEKD